MTPASATATATVESAPAPGALIAGLTGHRLEQRIRYDYDRPVSNLHQRLVVVPPEEHGGQRCTWWHLSVDGTRTAAERRTTTDRFGNVVVEVALERVAKSVIFVMEAVVTRAVTDDAHHVRRLPDYLVPTRLTRADEAIRAMAGEAAASTDPIARMCALTHRSLRYLWGVTGVATTAPEALAGGVGVCQDFAHIMLAGCRAIGVPARYVSGHLTGEGGSHAWVEVLRPDPAAPRKWQVEAWDPTHDCRPGSGYVTIAVGRDYADVAPMSGWYDGNANNRLTVLKSLQSI